MLKRNVEKNPADRGGFAIKTLVDRGAGKHQRALIAAEGCIGAAIDVSWELVEQQYQCDQALRGVGPMVQRAGDGTVNIGPESLLDNSIIVRCCLEPELVASGVGHAVCIERANPEFQYFQYAVAVIHCAKVKPPFFSLLGYTTVTATINLPRILRVGAGASDQLAATLAELEVERPLLVTDPFMVECGYVERMLAHLRDAGYADAVFAECVPDPTTDSVAAALQQYRDGAHDSVIALGGGSSIDTAKAVAVMAEREGPMQQYKVPFILSSGAPVIAIPTTAGTGSEATRVAVITDAASSEKMLWMGLGLMPVAALVDYQLTLSMPYRLTADTGIDSLCHALEAYVSRKANPFTDSVALTAMRTISTHLPTACAEPDNRVAREAMMLAATQGGIAFANASVTLIHGMSRPIGAFYHVPHGLSNAMLLPEVTAWSIAGAPQRYAEAARVMNMAAPADNDTLACDKLVAGLRQLTADLSVPTPATWGIEESAWLDALPVMAEQALESGSPANNPRIPGAQEIVELYQRVWSAA